MMSSIDTKIDSKRRKDSKKKEIKIYFFIDRYRAKKKMLIVKNKLLNLIINLKS